MRLNAQVALHFLSAHAGTCMFKVQYSITVLGASSNSFYTAIFW